MLANKELTVKDKVPSTNTIVLLRGYSGAGKDTVGNVLVSKHGFRRFAFADGLKQMIAHEYGCSLATLHSPTGKQEICGETGESWREIMIRVALEAKHTDADVFAGLCMTEMRMAKPDRAVITDWRFPNEYDVLKRAFPGARLVTVEVRRHNESPVDDESEHALADVWPDFTVDNTGDLAVLEATVDALAARIL